MKIDFSNRIKENVISGILVGLVIVSVYFLFLNFNSVKAILTKTFDILLPFISGFALAFILLPITNHIERILPKSMKFATRRKISVFLSMLCFFLVLSTFLGILIPQLVFSATQLSNKMSEYITNASKFIMDLNTNLNISSEVSNYILSTGSGIVDNVIVSIRNYLPQLLSSSINFITKTFSMIIGIIIAVYILLDREKFALQIKKTVYGLFGVNVGNRFVSIMKLSNRVFNSFIIGKIIDSIIIGILCFIGMTIFKFDYVLLISFIVGLTNMIPVFGPFIGAIPGIFILFIINPISALWFALFILGLQQFDGNILGPYILGDSLGLSSLWVMFAILLGGGLFGIVGMFLGVPVFAIFYHLFKGFIYRRLHHQNININ
ncbi:MAG: AI-2E family transporter [Erysipelotrichaceae bacterium]|nr:AI-2E family transporter [Erysipelotrichaceae bacterium]